MSRSAPFLPFLLLLLPHLGAQEGSRQVPPGREIREHKLLTLGKTDRWEFPGKQGEMLHCVVESSAFDPVLSLVDGTGTLLGENDGEGTRSELWLRAPKDGPLAFRVQGFEGSGGGHYSFVLVRMPTSDLPADGEAHHRFGEEQWWHYRVPLRQGDILVPTVTGQGRVTRVFDPSRQDLVEWLGGYRALVDGDHFVRIEGEADRECDLALALARQRDLGQGVQDTMPPHGFDVWRLPVRQGEALALHLAVAAGPGPFDLIETAPGRGPAFVWTGALDKGGSHWRWLVARKDAQLELRVRNPSHLASACGITLQREAVRLEFGAPVQAVLPLGGGTVYELPGTPGEVLRVSVTSAAFDAQFDLWAPDGTVLANVDDRSPLDRNPERTFLVERPGRHRLLVFCPGGTGGGAYEVRVDRLELPELRPDAPLVLPVRTDAPGHCHVMLTAGAEWWLSARSASCDAAVTVLGPDGRALGTWEGGGTGGNVLTAFRAGVDGRHTVVVHSRRGNGECEVLATVPHVR